MVGIIDVGQRGDRQKPHRHQADEHERDHQQRRRHRPQYERREMFIARPVLSFAAPPLPWQTCCEALSFP
jgi:hypothetical protein